MTRGAAPPAHRALRWTGLRVDPGRCRLASSSPGQTDDDYTIRQATYDLRKLRAKHLVVKLGRSHCYHVPPDAARVMAGVVALRDHVIAPILAGIRSPRPGRKPSRWTTVDRDYEQIRVNMHKLFNDLAIERDAA